MRIIGLTVLIVLAISGVAALLLRLAVAYFVEAPNE